MSNFIGYGHPFCRQHATSKLPVEKYVVLWEPENCDCCQELIKVAFQRPYLPEPERKAVVNYLRKRADEFK